MTRSSLPTVGFDRYIEFSWADYALDLAVSKGSPDQLRDWLYSRIEGEVSARKTFNQLCNLWFKAFDETDHIRSTALILAPKVSQSERIVLHWGMALANFELFQQTTYSMGKLINLQGVFKQKDIQQRTAELYSNQGTVPRAVRRIIQSLCEWKLIREVGKQTYKVDRKYGLKDEKLVSFLLQAILNRQRHCPISMIEIFRLPELFPFEINENGKRLIHESPIFTIIREGMNQEYVALS